GTWSMRAKWSRSMRSTACPACSNWSGDQSPPAGMRITDIPPPPEPSHRTVAPCYAVGFGTGFDDCDEVGQRLEPHPVAGPDGHAGVGVDEEPLPARHFHQHFHRVAAVHDGDGLGYEGDRKSVV